MMPIKVFRLSTIIIPLICLSIAGTWCVADESDDTSNVQFKVTVINRSKIPLHAHLIEKECVANAPKSFTVPKIGIVEKNLKLKRTGACLLNASYVKYIVSGEIDANGKTIVLPIYIHETEKALFWHYRQTRTLIGKALGLAFDDLGALYNKVAEEGKILGN